MTTLADDLRRINTNNTPIRRAQYMAEAIDLFLTQALNDDDPGEEAATVGDWRVAQAHARELIDALKQLRRGRHVSKTT